MRAVLESHASSERTTMMAMLSAIYISIMIAHAPPKRWRDHRGGPCMSRLKPSEL